MRHCYGMCRSMLVYPCKGPILEYGFDGRLGDLLGLLHGGEEEEAIAYIKAAVGTRCREVHTVAALRACTTTAPTRKLCTT